MPKIEKKKLKERKRPAIGWREWVALPDLGVKCIKAKIDTGARTSALHAFEIEYFERRKREMVRFQIHPMQRDDATVVCAEAELVDMRLVRDSGGRESIRPVIETMLKVGDYCWPIELTLINRDQMGFRMLLGRSALKGHLLVDPSRSFIIGKYPPKTK